MKKLFSVFFCLLFTMCGRPTTLQYKKIFQGTLGTDPNNIGSNIPILEAYDNRQGLTDLFLIDTPKIRIRNKKIYVPDTYNKRISVFKMQSDTSSSLELTIPNKGKNYEFARPYDLYVDRDENIFVLASILDFESYEIQNYSNISTSIKEYDQFQKNVATISNENFYVYKFSPKGEFLLRLSLNGKPFSYPTALSGDNFNNLYVYINSYTSNNQNQYSVYRYNGLTGNLNFQFDSQNINILTNISGTNYKGSILAIKNFIHDEQLLILTEYQPTTNNKGESIPSMIENIWSSVNVYSILENDFTSVIFKTKNITEDILGVDTKGSIFFQSYNNDAENLKIRILDTSSSNEKLFYAPLHSSYYIMNDYFIDSHGNIFNHIIDRNKYLIILKWRKDNESED
ncbi:MAG: hypothetical protein ACRCV0_02380 [Brevinema sp.]